MKLTTRKGFNFFRSYFDVYNELEDADKLQFINALLNRQFMGEKPKDLKGMAKFAYISQTNSIDNQVKGYEDKTKTRLDGSVYVLGSYTPADAPCDGVILPPTVQEKEEEKEEEEDKGEVEVEDVLKNIDTLLENYKANERLVTAICESQKFDKVKLFEYLNEFNEHLKSQGRFSETWHEYTKYFLSWVRIKKNLKPKFKASNQYFIDKNGKKKFKMG